MTHLISILKQRKNTELCRNIHDEREVCVELQVQIKILEAKQEQQTDPDLQDQNTEIRYFTLFHYQLVRTGDCEGLSVISCSFVFSKLLLFFHHQFYDKIVASKLLDYPSLEKET